MIRDRPSTRKTVTIPANPVRFKGAKKGQTFTAGLSGVLDHIDVGNTSGGHMLPDSAPFVEIWTTTAGCDAAERCKRLSQ